MRTRSRPSWRRPSATAGCGAPGGSSRRDGTVVHDGDDADAAPDRRPRDLPGHLSGRRATACSTGAPADASADERLKILDRTSLAVVTLDREGVVTSWNAGATEHFRLAAHETVGRQVLDLARSDEDRAYVESLMSPHVERDEWVSRLTIRPPDDEAYEALVTCSAIRSDDGELSGFLMITAPLDGTTRASAPRMRRARVQCAACGREVAGTMRRKYCSEKCRQWAYYHRHLDAQRERSRQRHERRRVGRGGRRAAGRRARSATSRRAMVGPDDRGRPGAGR